MENLKCPICGEATSVYMGNARKDRLCRSHGKMLRDGELAQCEKCNEWYFTKEGCKKCNTNIPQSQTPQQKAQEGTVEQTTAKCIGCGEASGEYWFCKKCYARYKSKELLIRITKCNEATILDESYEGIYICKDGHVVKSKSERDIDNYLFEHKIAHAYEKALWIDGDEFHPDFCLFFGEKKVYIEHWGYDESNAEYTRQKQYKLEKYQKANITLICTHEKYDAKDMETALEHKLNDYKENQINYLEK